MTTNTINGFRLTTERRGTTIQDLATGRWCHLPHTTLPGGGTGVGGRGSPLHVAASMLPALTAIADPEAAFKVVAFGDVQQALAGHDAPRRAPRFPVPTVAEVRRLATPQGDARPIGASVEADVTAVLMVATALAWRGGSAKGFELENDLATLAGGLSGVPHFLITAAARSGNNIRRSGADRFATWEMAAEWTTPDWMRQRY